MICIGELNKRLVIEDMTRTSDGAGGSDVSWSNFAIVWAKLRPRHGREKLWADAITANTGHVITIRFVDGLQTRMRFVDGARIFEITSIINVDENDQWLSCLCEEIPA